MNGISSRLSSSTIVNIFMVLLPVFIVQGNYHQAFGQTFESDTLAVRAILDSNGLTDMGFHEIPEWDSAQGRITFLDLGGLELATLPADIGDIAQLVELSLSDNLLTTLPEEFGNLEELVSLLLDYNQLSELPVEIGGLPKLEFIDLSQNQLNQLPAIPEGVNNLRQLHLDYNLLTTLPPEIENLDSLTDLSITNNQLDSLPEEIGQLALLERILADNNSLSTLPAGIGQLSNLEQLRLEDNELVDLPPEIINLSQEIALHVSDNYLVNLSDSISAWVEEHAVYDENEYDHWMEAQDDPSVQVKGPGSASPPAVMSLRYQKHETYLSIFLPENDARKTIHIHDVTGRIIQEFSTSKEHVTWDIGWQARGVYYLRARIGSQVTSWKIVL